jgi:hypothetical protein
MPGFDRTGPMGGGPATGGGFGYCGPNAAVRDFSRSRWVRNGTSILARIWMSFWTRAVDADLGTDGLLFELSSHAARGGTRISSGSHRRSESESFRPGKAHGQLGGEP